MELGHLSTALGRTTPRGFRVDAWSLHAVESRRLALGIKDRQAGNPHAPLTVAESASVTYRLVWNDGRVSRGRLERAQLDEDLGALLDEVRASAYDDPDAAHVLGPAEFPTVELFDPPTAAVAGGDTAPIVRRLGRLREILGREGVRTWSGSFSASSGRARLLTSRGLDVAAEGTGTGWHVTVNGELGDGFHSRRAEEEEAFVERVERLLRVAALLDVAEAAAPSGVVRVLLHPRVVEEYVLETLFSNLDGSAVAHGESHFRRDAFGGSEPVLREDLRLRVDPLQPLRAGSYTFTGEGLPAAPCTYVDGGRLVTPVLDVKYARRLDLPPTPLPSSTDTLEFGGSRCIALDEALVLAGDGALVPSVLGVHTQDRSSGDFSLSAPQTLAVRGGAPVGRFRSTMSGNLFDILRDPTTEFVRFPGDHCPGLLVRCRLDPK